MKKPAIILVIVAALAPALGVRAYAQSDEVPLGDVARSFRKTQAPPSAVIDNDNLPKVIEDGEAHKWATTTLRFSLDPTTLAMLNASPDVTCALSFNAQSSPSSEPKPQTLPATELAKLDGPAAIVGDTLQVSVYNGSQWDVREITVGLTIVKKPATPATTFAAMQLLPASLSEPAPTEKHPDATVLYHLKGSAAPLTTTRFREALTIPLPPGQEWHWTILQAKGIPPAPAPTPPPVPQSTN
jgi:hypothetical protein